MLLSRTADHLYWHARYIERAENTARMLGVNYETLLMPHEAHKMRNLWRATLELSELEPQFIELYGEINTANVLQLGVAVVTAFEVCRLVAVLLAEPIYRRWVMPRE